MAAAAAAAAAAVSAAGIFVVVGGLARCSMQWSYISLVFGASIILMPISFCCWHLRCRKSYGRNT